MASPSPSPSRPRAADDATAVVIASRCSFETAQAFHAAEMELRARQHDATARDIRRKPTKYEPPPACASPSRGFVTAVKSPSQFVLKTDAAKRNDHAKTPYKPPSDFAHRAASPPESWKRPGEDFVAKFHVPSTQDLRRSVALDQEGFFSTTGTDISHTYKNGSGTAGTQLVASDHPNARRPGSPTRSATTSPVPPRPDFQSSVPHTTRKSANVALRLETIVDQDGLLPQLREIRAHKFRDDHDTPLPPGSPPASPASSSSPSVEPFRATFKPAPSLRPIGGGNI